jgi:hypothetical protein
MAVAQRPESLLPALKCSTCGEEIDILSLADHVCLPSTSNFDLISVVRGCANRITEPTGGNTINDPSSGRTNIMKGDHAVQLDPSVLFVDPAVQQGTRYLNVQQPSSSPGFLRSGKNVPPNIDAAAASKPPLRLVHA